MYTSGTLNATEAEIFAMPVVCMIVEDLKADGEKLILLQRRVKQGQSYYGVWEMPQGRIRAGETILSAAKRELKEETNLDLIELSSMHQRTTANILDSSLEALSPIVCTADIEHMYIGIGIIVHVSGRLTPTLEAINHVWMNSKEIIELMETNQIFPMNVLILKKYFGL